MLRLAKKSSSFVVLSFAAAFLTAPSASANISDSIPEIPGTYSTNELLIKYEEDLTTAEKRAVRKSVSSFGTSPLTELDPNSEILSIDPNKISISEAVALLSESDLVETVEPDYKLRKLVIQNLTTQELLWGMFGDVSSSTQTFGSAANQAWDLGYEGSEDIAIGVIDEGVQITHPDLAGNIWTNKLELDGVLCVDGDPNECDDDGNGYGDDVHGWDFYNDDASVFDGNNTDGTDEHGTHVAGTIGALGQNGGVTGVSPNVKIVTAKFLGPTDGSTSDAIKAIDYLVNLKNQYLANPLTGANIVAINNSWGGDSRSQSLLDAINRAGDAGILFVVASGNDGTNNDQAPAYPASYKCTNPAFGITRDWDCIVTVAAINKSGGLAKFSNYGNLGVDIAAPGGDCSNLNSCVSTAFDEILSTLPNNTFGSSIGTSMATPHVAGAIALCAAANPGLTAKELRNLVLNSASSTESLRSKVVTSGRLDVHTMIHGCAPVRDGLPPIVVNKAIPVLQSGGTFSHTFLAMGGNGSYTWNLTGQLPSGIAFDPASGVLSGNPTEVGDFPVSVSATSGPNTDSQVFNVKINKIAQSTFAISNESLSGYVGQPLALKTTGGSGTGAITFATSSPGCTITNDQLVAESVVDCLVRATKSESGVYSSATSNPVGFSFTLAPAPAAVPAVAQVQPKLKTRSSLAPKSVASLAGVSVPKRSKLTISVSKKYAKVCKVRKSRLVTTKKVGVCKVTIKVKPRNGKRTSQTVSFAVNR
jgi:subtilisin family serine protease